MGGLKKYCIYETNKGKDLLFWRKQYPQGPELGGRAVVWCVEKQQGESAMSQVRRRKKSARGRSHGSQGMDHRRAWLEA